MSILRRIGAGSILVLLDPGSQDVVRNIISQAVMHGISPKRIFFVPKVHGLCVYLYISSKIAIIGNMGGSFAAYRHM